METVIAVNNLTKDYDQGRGVFDFSFAVKKGEVFGFVGSNGSGKTTTIRHMMGFSKPGIGNIKINGLDSWKDACKIKKSVGYVPGQINFPDVGTGRNFLKIQADFWGLKDLSYMNQLIERFKLDVDAPLKRMSKGMKQKTAIVAAFMAQPEILIMDEPSTGLDPMMRDELISLILEQKQQGKTIFMSSHIFKELEDTCDRVGFIHHGKLINIVDRNDYDPAMAKQYRIGFEMIEDYRRFLDESDDVVSWNDQYRHVLIRIGDEKVNGLFRILKELKVRYINYQPYTLEGYYTNLIGNQEEMKYV